MIYLDYNATAPVDPTVADAMIPFLREHHGNPSAGHAVGRFLRQAIDDARQQVATLLGARSDEIVFTSGGSEANNHALKGAVWSAAAPGDHIITSAVEHPAILAPCAFLERRGIRVTRVPVDATGMVDPDDVRKALTAKTALVSIMHANNEVGTIQPIPEIAQITREAGVLFHTDAAQSIGKIPVDVNQLGVDLLTLAGHKVYAPQGIGALFIRSGIQLEPLIHGAGHESGRRSGTEAVPSIVGLGAAAALVAGDSHAERIKSLRDKLFNLLVEGLGDGVRLNGHPQRRLPNTLNVSFRGVFGADVVANLDGVAASPGAACHAGSHEPSAVLKAMNVPTEWAVGAVRFSLGRPTTEAEIQEAARRVVQVIHSLIK